MTEDGIGDEHGVRRGGGWPSLDLSKSCKELQRASKSLSYGEEDDFTRTTGGGWCRQRRPAKHAKATGLRPPSPAAQPSVRVALNLGRRRGRVIARGRGEVAGRIRGASSPRGAGSGEGGGATAAGPAGIYAARPPLPGALLGRS